MYMAIANQQTNKPTHTHTHMDGDAMTTGV